ncbi:unnamed protein product [Prorocentrum cordatum]|uniref:HpcH/HpaI aldolase/citrate lyase domain-containing protein n=1 Tax=Prorocentrum cordatum TaxID=2364126 RepID=A0ABN9SBY0_9DINO|nr:unnamed protein product [Polarella glacialis]
MMRVAAGRALRGASLKSVACRLPGMQSVSLLTRGDGRTSFTQVPEVKERLNRCEMYVPGTQAKLIPKAAKSAADVIVMDLEDSVAEHLKDEARANVVKALQEVDFGSKTVAIRINGLYSHHTYKDVIDILEKGGERADVFIIPMVGNAKDVYAVDALTTQVETTVGRQKKIGFGLIIEATMGMMNVHEIAASSRRNESLHFGVADYAASTKSRTTNIGGANELYGVLTHADGDRPRDFFWGDPWHYAMSEEGPPGPTACAPSTAPSATSRTPTRTGRSATGPPPWASTGSGRSTRARWLWPTRSSARRRPRWRWRSASCRPWTTRSATAWGRCHWTAS